MLFRSKRWLLEPEGVAPLTSLQRDMHTLKGGAQFGDAQRTAAVAFDQAGGGRIEGAIQQLAQGLHARRGRADFLAGGQLVEHVDQRFVGLFGLLEKPLLTARLLSSTAP